MQLHGLKIHEISYSISESMKFKVNKQKEIIIIRIGNEKK